MAAESVGETPSDVISHNNVNQLMVERQWDRDRFLFPVRNRKQSKRKEKKKKTETKDDYSSLLFS